LASDQKEKAITKLNVISPNNDLKDFRIKIAESGRIQVGKKAWIIRIFILSIIGYFAIYRIYQGADLYDPFIIYSTIMPAITIASLLGAWFLYKSPSKDTATLTETDLVSVVIPVYNQKEMIETVIDSVYRSTYKNIEVIVVNDGSTDGTREILDQITTRYPDLKVIHQQRGGKRKASAAGFYASKGEFLLHIDSDSVIHENAIAEIMKTYKSNPKVGTVVGELRIWNANENLLTGLQEAWHNVTCNINKTFESSFRSVTCCSGPLASYRRDAIASFMPYWADSNALSGGGVDRELTAYLIGPKDTKKKLLQTLWPESNVTERLKKSAAQYDDADDRLLTSQSLEKWESAYVVTATTYVEGQVTLKGFIKQQTRWKKGFLRSNFYLSTFFWRDRHPFASLMYYLDLMAGLTTPLIICTVLFYETLVLELVWTPIAFIVGIIWSAFAQGIDMKLRCPGSRAWKYVPLMSLFGTFVLSWLLFAALWNFRKNSWLTR
jgi:hyaluronan synthase